MAVFSSFSRRLFRKQFPLFSFYFSFSTVSPSPPPIRVALTESVGRAVFATRPIAAADLIHTASPAVCHPYSGRASCYSCLAALSNSQPLRAPFCSQHCHQRSKGYYDVEMKANWVAFDDYCGSRGLKYPFLVKRLACMVIAGDARSDTLDILQPANFTPEMVSKMEEEFVLLRNAFAEALIGDDHIACILLLSRTFCTKYCTNTKDLLHLSKLRLLLEMLSIYFRPSTIMIVEKLLLKRDTHTCTHSVDLLDHKSCFPP
ncbi:histone-lysine N-methyltransferase ATXR4 isoform X2 [Vigna angularis]|uniref:histone-lysine N-methyltransferase ATXR4 isoform X2 n=1 Tax=Phaseolus angularis TaxID=3914 RepID=UPI0022B502B5|nr:histone-lysine N-methyltransferase ATXR4 isoform X2 [Vigna angularis]